MEKKAKRICMSVFGVLVCGISVGFFKIAAFGVDPFQSLMSGLDAIVGVGTIVTAFFMGPLIDFFNIHVAQPFLQKDKGSNK